MIRSRVPVPVMGAPVTGVLVLAVLAVLALAWPGAARGEAGRILYVDSYHQGYEWSDGIEAGLRHALRHAEVTLRVVHMDAKRNPDGEFVRRAAEDVVRVIGEFRPDVVVTSDDVATRAIAAERYADSDIPFVFCGVNWDASAYGLSSNTTGMVEVDLVQELFDLLRPYARGVRTGYISGDTPVDHKITAIFNQRYFFGAMRSYFAHTMDEFERLYLRAQDEVDILFVRNYAGIRDWDPERARDFVVRNTRVPTGAHNPWMASLAMVTLAKVPQEQGQWAARTALRILRGTPPSDIPVAINEQARLIVNMRLAVALGAILEPALLETAEFVDETWPYKD